MLVYVGHHARSQKVETVEFMLFVYALGPLLWISLAILCLVRQTRGPKLSLKCFVATLGVQIIVITLPFAIYNWSVEAAALSNFASCPNGQEYCDDFHKLERLRGRMLFHLGAAFWVGVVVLFLTMFRRADTRVARSAR